MIQEKWQIAATVPQPPAGKSILFFDADDFGTPKLKLSDGSVVALVGGGGGLPDAPNDGNFYARKNAAWATLPPTSKYILPNTGELTSADIGKFVMNTGKSDTNIVLEQFEQIQQGGEVVLDFSVMTDNDIKDWSGAEVVGYTNALRFTDGDNWEDTNFYVNQTASYYDQQTVFHLKTTPAAPTDIQHYSNAADQVDAIKAFLDTFYSGGDVETSVEYGTGEASVILRLNYKEGGNGLFRILQQKSYPLKTATAVFMEHQNGIYQYQDIIPPMFFVNQGNTGAQLMANGLNVLRWLTGQRAFISAFGVDLNVIDVFAQPVSGAWRFANLYFPKTKVQFLTQLAAAFNADTGNTHVSATYDAIEAPDVFTIQTESGFGNIFAGFAFSNNEGVDVFGDDIVVSFTPVHGDMPEYIDAVVLGQLEAVSDDETQIILSDKAIIKATIDSSAAIPVTAISGGQANVGFFDLLKNIVVAYKDDKVIPLFEYMIQYDFTLQELFALLNCGACYSYVGIGDAIADDEIYITRGVPQLFMTYLQEILNQEQ